RGDNGTLVIGPSVQFTSTPRRASNTPLAPVTSALYTTILHFFSEGAEVGTASASLMLPMPGAPDVTRNGYRFLGYFTAETGGTCIYGPDGAASSPVWESVENSASLYAHWEVAPTMLVVNTNEDGENLGQGRITLRDAMRALCADAALTGTSGVRRVEFDLPAEDGKNVITLGSAIAADAGTSPIEIDGFNDGRGVTITAGGAFGALQLSGSDASLRCLNFRGCPKPAVAHSGGLTVEDCSFIGNKGAIQGGRDATLAALNCTFADNEAEGAGGAVALADTSAYAAFVNCTFSRNKAADGSAVHSARAPLVFIHCTLVPSGAGALVSAPGVETWFLNTLVAKPAGGAAVAAGAAHSVCSSLGTQAQAEILNPPQADDLLGVRQIWYEPVQSSASGNRDAALVRYDYRLDNIAIVTNGVTELLYGDSADLATMPIGIDQLHGARMAPVRGAIRIATGAQPPVVNVEGVAWGLADATVQATATVVYDDGTAAEGVPLEVKTNRDAVFGTAVEVDGSDLYTHNVTEVRIDGIPGDPRMIVATSPYALVASSASAIATDESDVYLPGDEIRVTTALADSLVTTGLAVGGEAFGAGSLAGFRDITLDDVNVRGGALRLLGSISKDGGSQMANLSNKTIGGGEGEDSGSLSGGTKSWTAKYDGFVQVRAEAGDASSRQVGLTVGGTTVTPMGALGSGGPRTAVWTVPVRKGEAVTLHANGGSVGYKAQFVYFGVKE
ncbi:MAG: right-handed parallel beta-helix repeat-containing protein, partial [Kiritimatiellae bacterium]|nr:right-handed parallel beta-helix repeat-containing protein [Kiritimatiellia bacterium]